MQLEHVPGPIVGAVVGLTYFGAAQYVIWLNDPVNAGGGYWPAAGITLGALVLLPASRWAWVLGAIVVAEIGGGAIHDYPLAATSWWAAGNVTEPLVAVLLLRLLGREGRLTPIGELVPFLVCGVVVGPLVGASIGSWGTVLEYDREWSEVMTKWWAGDGLGVLVVAPLLLSVRERAGRRRSPLEAAVLAVIVLVVPLLAFRGWDREWDATLPYLVFPLVAWAALRFGVRGAAVAGFAVAEVANLATALGYGPFELAAGGGVHDVTLLQLFLASALTAALVAATFVHDALDRARLYERQRSVTDALQQSVLPEALPGDGGLELAARYAPASPDAALHVGGDWYDAFLRPTGELALVVGDIAGHDLDAAVVMSQLRNGLRSLLLELREPHLVLGALDRQVRAFDGPLATVILAQYADGDLCWSNAGHPPPLLARADGSVAYLGGEAQPLLGLGNTTYGVERATLGSGDAIVIFTDGLVEHRGWSLEEGLAHLAELVRTAGTRDAESLCDLLLTGGLDGRRREDDVCVLVARRP